MTRTREISYKEIYDATKHVSVKFCEWINKNRYQKYWGSDAPNCDKWYVPYTPPDRKYYTLDELYDLFSKEYL